MLCDVQAWPGVTLMTDMQAWLDRARAAQEKEVLRDPPPAVRMTEFGDSALKFELRVWSDSQVHRKGWLVSALNMAIHERFREEGIEIPFPQRDLHIRSGGAAPRQAE